MAFEHQVIRVKGSSFERGVAYGENHDVTGAVARRILEAAK